MARWIKAVCMMTFFLFPGITVGGEENPGPFSPYVDKNGAITLPRDFRATWVHLGSWAVPASHEPGSGFHDVYTQPESYRAYSKDGKWPDGAVLVKEIRKVRWDEMASGHVVYGDEPSAWFVMVKDVRGRFPGHPNWGEGWGWALFEAADPAKNASTDYKEDCLACHEPARDTDWIYIQGYPTLR